MAEKKMYVVHTQRGYWIGAFIFNEQLRFAKIYTSLHYANETVERIKRAYPNEDAPKVLEVQLCLAQNIPTADVVPRSEYESLRKRMFPSYCQAVTEEEAMKIGYERGKVEVAKEIFEEIERKLPNEFPFLGTAVAVYLEELKKKYTEKGGKHK